MEHKISIIVPIYNSSAFIERCINSLITQSYTNIEIIIVDDGSTDDSKRLCNLYASENSRIKIYEQEHSGIGVARNVGVSKATGEYVVFVDSDDWVDQDMCLLMIHGLKDTNSEMVVCNYMEVYKDSVGNTKEREDAVLTVLDYIKRLIVDPKDYYYGVLWNKIYIRDIISEHNILFDERINHGEDFIFNMQYLTYINKICILKEINYYYNRTNSDSLDRIKKDYQIRTNNRVNMFLSYRDLFLNKNLYTKYGDEIDFYIIDFVINEYRQILFRDKISFRDKQLEISYINRQCLKQFGLWNPKVLVMIYVTLMKRCICNR